MKQEVATEAKNISKLCERLEAWLYLSIERGKKKKKKKLRNRYKYISDDEEFL